VNESEEYMNVYTTIIGLSYCGCRWLKMEKQFGLFGKMAAGFHSTTIIADEQFVERQRLFEDFFSSDV
jgi:hypothetical protein